MRTSINVLLSLVFVVLLSPAFAAKQSYVVYMGFHSHANAADREKVAQSHHHFLASFLGSKHKAKKAIFYSYTHSINGFAATLEDDEASQISKHPGVVSIFPNEPRKLHTTRSWDFLGLGNPAHSLWNKARFGKDVIIGNLDTGVWPESKSFYDEGLRPIPPKWRGICQNCSDHKFQCNRKLIGARYFKKGYESAVGPLNCTYSTPRDDDGHGTHTLSTAGGNFVSSANVLSFGNGTAKGGSPMARVAAYKVCWPVVGESGGCYGADILAAFDSAIEDGVDVLSASIGGRSLFFNDVVAIGSFHAVMHGIVVVCSAGNSGPNLSTVVNVAPWQITVGASTLDRRFPSNLILIGTNLTFMGESLSDISLPETEWCPIIYARYANATNATADKAELCEPGSLDPTKVKGNILICLRGITARVDKGEQAALAGAVGMVLANDKASGNEIIADAHVLPATHISYTDGLSLISYLKKQTSPPKARITKPTTQLHIKPAPVMAAFSSRGPNPIMQEILKPDITAPGVNIIAAFTEAKGPTELDSDKRRVKFNALSGTSMSCPHVAGVVGLLKAVHPKWSPAAIRSAIMTTASTYDNTWKPIYDTSGMIATPLAYGAGHINPNEAADPGLVYDLGTVDYLNLLCAISYDQNKIHLFLNKTYVCPKPNIRLIDFNYPSITVPKLNGSVIVTRKLKNVGSLGTYKASVGIPPGISVQVEPKAIEFKSIGEEKQFNVTITAGKNGRSKGFTFGKLTWSDGQHVVTSPLVVKQI